MITLSIFFLFKICKFLWIVIVSGEVRFVFIILELYFIPRVPIEAAGILFIFNIMLIVFIFSNYIDIYKGLFIDYFFLFPPAISLILIDNKKFDLLFSNKVE